MDRETDRPDRPEDLVFALVAGWMMDHVVEPVEPPASPDPLVGALEAAGIRDPRVIGAFRRVARERFVPPASEPEARIDDPIPIGRKQVTTQPSLIARMLESLEIAGGERVLEVGTGHGYQTALLVELGAEVHSIERFDELARVARGNLDEAGYGSAEIVVGDGTLGHAIHAPFHAVVVSAAAPAVPRALAEQLVEGGRLVMPIGPGGDDEVIAFRKEHGRLRRVARLCRAYFVPLIGRHASAPVIVVPAETIVS